MKKVLVFMIFTAFLAVTAGCSKDIQKTDEATGYYYEVNPNSKTVASAVEFLELELNKNYKGLKIVSVEKAEAQIVAGTNYKLICVYSYNGKEKNLKAVIYENLDGVKKVTDLDMP